MKRLIFVLMLLASVIIPVSAQTSQLATLLHDGNLSIFYGASALGEAHSAASAGDVITLSSGQFNACNLTKPVTIRGAGMGLTNTEAFVFPTIITGDFKINIPEDPDHYLVLEGIRHDTKIELLKLYDAQFIKCVFGDLILPSISSGNFFENLMIMHCNIQKSFEVTSGLTSTSGKGITTLTAINSIIPIKGTALSSHFAGSFKNCIIKMSNTIYKSVLDGCLLTASNSNQALGGSCTPLYCAWYGTGSNNPFPNNVESHTSNTRLTQDNVFKEGTFYEIADELKALKTSDNTEVGIYGGTMPFDPTTTVPQISRFSVSPRTSADGKLSIDIEVEGIKQ